MREWLYAPLLTCFLTPCLASAQAQPPPQDKPQTPPPAVLKTTTRLVEINIVVQDKKGEPFESLKKEDFTIRDQGQEQQIAVFATHSGTPVVRPSVPTLPSNVFTNRFNRTGQAPGSVTVILFDALNTAVLDQAYARQQVIRFLKQLQPQDHVAIYLLTRQLTVLNEFTQDASSLLRAIERFQGYSSAPLDASTPDTSLQDAVGSTTPATGLPGAGGAAAQLNDFLNGASGIISDFANIDRVATTTSAIEAIANHVAQIPGRKSLIWVSGSFPMTLGFDADTLMDPVREHRSFDPELERAARALNEAKMSIYPVDARGLMTAPISGAANSQRFNPRNPGRGVTVDTSNFDTMNFLADRTGGKAYYNTNDIEGAVRRVLADGEYTYTLGFYPTHGKWDGKFHELKVQVNEKGLTLHYRKGYFASPDPPGGPAESQAALDAALWSPVEWTNLDLQATLKSFETGSRMLTIQMAMDTHELKLTSKEGRWSGDVEFLFVQLGAGDKPITRQHETFTLNLKPETYEALVKNGTKITGKLKLLPDVVTLRVVGRDVSSGAIGSLVIPIKKLLPAENASGGDSAAAPKPAPARKP
jgi:VWFA-related protein